MSIISELRITCRTLTKNPAFTITAITVLTLGIGANTAIFSVVNEVLFNPAGVKDPGRIAELQVKYDKLAIRGTFVSVPDFDDVHNSTQLIEAAAIELTQNFNYSASGNLESLKGATVSVEWFGVFGANPRLGRVFRP